MPTHAQLEQANVVRLARRLGCDDYAALHRVSIEEPDRFWRAVREDLGIPLARDWDAVLDDSRGIEWTTWFEGARLNVAEICVHRWARERPDDIAAISYHEDGEEWHVSYRMLSERVTGLAEGLRSARRRGRRPRRALRADDDRGGHLLTRLCAPRSDTGADLLWVRRAGGVQRLRDSGAKVVITSDVGNRRGREVAVKQTTRRRAG